VSPWVGSSSAQRLTNRSATPCIRLGPAITSKSLTGHDNPAAGIRTCRGHCHRRQPITLADQVVLVRRQSGRW
jgi:hypothetical protein